MQNWLRTAKRIIIIHLKDLKHGTLAEKYNI